MSRILCYTSRVCIGLLLIGGVLVTFGQVIGILSGSPRVVEYFGTDVLNVVCVIAGLAGICAFLRLYTRDGRAVAAAEYVEVDEA